MTFLLLPNCKTQFVPQALASHKQLQLDKATQGTSLSAWSDSIEQQLELTPDLILGCEQIPAMAWMAARRLYPETRALCFESADQHWRDIHSLDIWSEMPKIENQENVPDKASVIEDKTTPSTFQKKLKSQQPKSKMPPSIKQMGDKQLLHELFKISAWGNHPEQVQKIMLELSERSARDTSLTNRAVTMKELGDQACTLGHQAVSRLKIQFFQEGEAALESVLN